MIPIKRTNIPHQEGNGLKKSNMNLRMPYIPVLIITPDIRAEMWLGAAGCASGSQICKGTIPALVPKPSKINKNKIAFNEAGIRFEASLKDTNEKLPVYLAKIRNVRRRNAEPICVIKR